MREDVTSRETITSKNGYDLLNAFADFEQSGILQVFKHTWKNYHTVYTDIRIVGSTAQHASGTKGAKLRNKKKSSHKIKYLRKNLQKSS